MSNLIRLTLHRLWLAGGLGLMLAFLTSCYVPPLRVISSISPEPLVGRAVNYHVEVSSPSGGAPNTTLTITLPSGIELIAGDLAWQGNIAKDQAVVKDLIIQVTTPGDWIVTAYVDTDMGAKIGHTYLSASQSLYITSSSDSAEVVDALQKTPTPCYGKCLTPVMAIPITPHKP